MPVDAKFFGRSTIGWDSGNAAVTGGVFELRGLNGVLEHTVGGGKVTLDEHDLQRLANGNYLAILDVTRTGPDLSSWGIASPSHITDNVIVELNSKNQTVWSWSVADHIDLAASNVNWRTQYPDVIHMNSIQYFGDHEILLSVRHLDAVYAIDMTTGAILWKLGGTPTPQSLTVVGDQYASADPDHLFSGQHDARILPDGSLTVQDNGTVFLRQVRALRFRIDTAARTATEIAQVTDARMGPAFCCGAVDRLPTGDWLASWGTAQYATELTPAGAPVLTVVVPTVFFVSGRARPTFDCRVAKGHGCHGRPTAPLTRPPRPTRGAALGGEAVAVRQPGSALDHDVTHAGSGVGVDVRDEDVGRGAQLGMTLEREAEPSHRVAARQRSRPVEVPRSGQP